jgi:hypothetical protein
VPLEELVRLVEVLRPREPPVAVVERRPEGPPDLVPDDVAEEGERGQQRRKPATIVQVDAWLARLGSVDEHPHR